MRVCMIGTGYVGLVSGSCLADFGNAVQCVDINEDTIATLNDGGIPIYEPGLKDMVARNVRSGRLAFSTNVGDAVKASDVVFIAVGTPAQEDGATNLTYVFDVAETIAEFLNGYKVVVQKSTVPVGTTREVARRIKAKVSADTEFDVVSNPEFLREGSAVEDFLRPNRVVIGVESDRAEQIMKQVYRPLYLLETPVVLTTLETAELTKHASNAFLATKISFINEIAAICELVGANVDDVAKGMGLDGRIGPKFLHAGVGFGGSCLPKDISSLNHLATSRGYVPHIVRAILELNNGLPDRAVDKLTIELGSIEGKTIGLLGLAFKPNTDDLREAPAIRIVKRLLEEKAAAVRVFDPVAMENFKITGLDVVYCKNAYDVADGCDGLMLVTEWNEFRQLDLPRLKKVMNEAVFVDCRNVYKPDRLEAYGFRYQSFGRGVAET
ncbi:MAG: UDP-glucose/GDP-mannose dehydrogenase family protein [Candidatus Latescibacterota bacterium]|nr:MAG: UDP-glucose/GDP-mannose dehydrogenase family protein [Candidatus Latescibacterota bacterium]